MTELGELVTSAYQDGAQRDWMHRTQAEHLEAVLRGTARACRREGSDEIHRTNGQIYSWISDVARHLTCRQIQSGPAITVRRVLRYGITAGFIDSFEPQYNAQGEGTGILIRMAPGAVERLLSADSRGCSSVGSSSTRRRPEGAESSRTGLRRFSVAGLDCPEDSETVYPPGGTFKGAGRCPTSSRQAVRARERDAGRRAPETRDRAALGIKVRAAIAELLAEHGFEVTGVEALPTAPWLLEVPRIVLLRELMRIAHPSKDLRISLRRERGLLADCRKVERFGYVGADGAKPELAVAALLWDIATGDYLEEVINDHDAKPARRGGHALTRTPPRTLGGLAICVRRYARERRREIRARREADRG